MPLFTKQIIFMKIVSWNVNGLRAVYRKNFLNFVREENPDILCLQEIKANESQIPKEAKPEGYSLYLNPAEKKGYSGVAVYTKEKPLKIELKTGFERFDGEGRLLLLDFGKFTLANLYFPHGGRKKENLGYKLEVYEYFLDYAKRFSDKKAILIGDFNIAREEIDLARPKQNKNNIMFTLEERQRLEKLISLGFIDTFRKLNPEKVQYTWWPYFANARERNLGWRIDYAFASGKIFPYVKESFILDKVPGSDHCPIGIMVF